jgi:hypothetical protein
MVMNQEPLITSCNPLSPNSEKRQPVTLSMFFVTVQFGPLSYIAMSSASKALAHGILIVLEITIVILFVASLAAIAVLSSLGGRKRNRSLENARMLCLIGSATDHHAD